MQILTITLLYIKLKKDTLVSKHLPIFCYKKYKISLFKNKVLMENLTD